MDDWIRPRLDDLASDAPTGAEVPPTLRRRARVKMTVTVFTSLLVVASLGVGAVAAARSLWDGSVDTGTSPSPSVDRSQPDLYLPDRVTVTLTDSGCTSDWRGVPIDPRRVEFVAENETDGSAVFDIGRLRGEHTYEDLTAHVQGLGTGVVGRLIEEVIPNRPPYFQGSIDGTVIHPHGSGIGGSLLRVFGSPWKWSAPHGRRAPEGIYAVICYRSLASAGGLVAAGVVGPFEVAMSSSDPAA